MFSAGWLDPPVKPLLTKKCCHIFKGGSLIDRENVHYSNSLKLKFKTVKL